MSRNLPEADLSSAFGKSPRAAGLKLPESKKTAKAPAKPPRAVSPVPAPEPDESPESSQSAAESPSRAAGRGAAKAGARSTPRPAAGQGRLVLWSPLSLRARMQAEQTSRGTLYLDQVLDALEATVDQLPDLIEQASSTPHVQGRLFERAVADAPEAREQRVQLTIRGILDSQLQIIDEMVRTSGAPSRSALVNAALDAALPQL